MNYKAVYISCDESVSETLSFLLQNIAYSGTSYENNQLVAYCQLSLFDESKLLTLLSRHDIVPDKIVDVPNQNWNKLWEQNFKDADIGAHVHARAPFHPSKPVKHDIIIHPKMAFGTGHHENTQLAAIALEKLDCVDKTVLDMGCGSGLLAILASQKEAKKVVAVDHDIHCTNNAAENVKLNNARNVTIVQSDSLRHIDEHFDIIVSNMVKNSNLKLLPQFAQKLAKNGILILSGFIAEDIDILEHKATSYGFELQDKNIQNSWLQTQFINRYVD